MSLNAVIDNLVSDVFQNKLVSGLTITDSGTYRRVTTGTFDASTRTLSKTKDEIPINIIKSDSTSTEDAQLRQSNTITFIVRPIEGVLPEQGIDDELVVGGVEYKVVNVSKASLGSTSLMYKITALT